MPTTESLHTLCSCHFRSFVGDVGVAPSGDAPIKVSPRTAYCLSQASSVVRDGAAPAQNTSACKSLPEQLRARLQQRKTDKLLAEASLQLQSTAAALATEKLRNAELEAQVQRLSSQLHRSETEVGELSGMASAACDESERLGAALATARARAHAMEAVAKKFKQQVAAARQELANKEQELQRSHDREDDLVAELATEEANNERIVKALEGEVLAHEASRALGVTVTMDDPADASLGAGGFGEVFAVHYVDPLTGDSCAAALKVATKECGVGPLLSEGDTMAVAANDPTCFYAVPRLPLGGAVKLCLPGGHAAAALLMDRADDNLSDACDRLRMEALVEAQQAQSTSAGSEESNRGAEAPWWELLRLGTDFVSNVQALHAAGVLHGDVKPANALLKNGRVLTCDFGSARREADAVDLAVSSTVVTGPRSVSKLWPISEAGPATEKYQQPASLRLDSEHIGYAADGWATMVSVMDMFGLHAYSVLGVNHADRFSEWLVDAVVCGNIGVLVQEKILELHKFCPAKVAAEAGALVEMAVYAHKQGAC